MPGTQPQQQRNNNNQGSPNSVRKSNPNGGSTQRQQPQQQYQSRSSAGFSKATAANRHHKQAAASQSPVAVANGHVPEFVNIDGVQISTSDLEPTALLDYLRANPTTANAKRCMVYPDCAKGESCTFAHLKASRLAQFTQAAQAAASNPYEDKLLMAYVGVPEIICINQHNHSIHELEPTALFDFLRSRFGSNGNANPASYPAAEACKNFPNCSRGKDCSFAHMKATRIKKNLPSLVSAPSNNAAAASSSSAGNNNNNNASFKAKAAAVAAAVQEHPQYKKDEDTASPAFALRVLKAYVELPEHVLVDGHHVSIHDLEPNNLFNYFLQHPESPTARHCVAYPFCTRGKDCSFAHLKSTKLAILKAYQERTAAEQPQQQQQQQQSQQQQFNNNKKGSNANRGNTNSNNNNTSAAAASSHTQHDEEYRGLPNTVLVDGVIINVHDLEPSNLFAYLRSTPDAQAARRCTYFPECPKGKTCGFAHFKSARLNPSTAFINAKPSENDYRDLPATVAVVSDTREGRKDMISIRDLEPTLLFDFIRLHPTADNIKTCRNFPYCRNGRGCGYAHLKTLRKAAMSGMPITLNIEGDVVDVARNLVPTAMFSYASKHPDAQSFRWCKHWPECNDGDACTYAHRKQ